jgi:hypothetical protein
VKHTDIILKKHFSVCEKYISQKHEEVSQFHANFSFRGFLPFYQTDQPTRRRNEEVFAKGFDVFRAV